MFALLSFILADGVTIKIGDNVWTFGLNFIVYLIVAAIVGLLAEFIVGWRLPFGFIGAIIAAIIGIWSDCSSADRRHHIRCTVAPRDLRPVGPPSPLLLSPGIVGCFLFNSL